MSSSVRAVQALGEHHAEAALQLRVARLLERRDGGVALEELLALERGLAALRAAFAVQRPAAEEILLEHDLHVARRIGRGGHGLQVEAHGVRDGAARSAASATF